MKDQRKRKAGLIKNKISREADPPSGGDKKIENIQNK
jgi:hypothetical protein